MPFPFRTNPESCRYVHSAVIMAASGLLVAACTLTTPTSGDLADDKRLLATCSNQPPAALVAIDGTGSSKAKAITEERLAAVEQIARRTAVCLGRLRVLVFSSSSAATITLYDQALHPHGATDNARLKRVPELVKSAMQHIRPGYSAALTKLPGGGSDITGQLRLAADWQRQLGSGHQLEAYIFTDGLENVERRVGGRNFNARKAKQLAATTTAAKLPGASLTVAGLGRVAGKPPRSSVVEGLVAYYTALCKKSGAAACLAVTDYAQAGR